MSQASTAVAAIKGLQRVLGSLQQPAGKDARHRAAKDPGPGNCKIKGVEEFIIRYVEQNVSMAHGQNPPARANVNGFLLS